jgi:hypothetical protein
VVEPRGVVALEREALAAIELEDPARHVVEEVAIVGHRDDGARVVVQEALEPRDALGVEVVGGLVEQQNVRLFQEQTAERDATPLTAGEGVDLGLGRGQTQRIHRALDHAIDLPAIDVIDLLLELPVLLEQRVHLVARIAEQHADLFEARDQPFHRSDRVLDGLLHGLPGLEARLLREEADAQAFGGLRFALEVLVHPRHDAQQRALARAVDAEHADLRAGQKREPEALDQLAVGLDHLAEVLHLKDELVGHRGRLLVRPRALGYGQPPARLKRACPAPSAPGRGPSRRARV